MSRGWKGSLLITPPQPEHVQLPSYIVLSPLLSWRGAEELSLRPLEKQSRHLSPAVLRGSNGSSVITPPQPLHVQFP